jgi:hypothetical protein
MYARTEDRDAATTWATREAQYNAVCAWGIPDHALLQRLSCLQMPVFVANGDSDPRGTAHRAHRVLRGKPPGRPGRPRARRSGRPDGAVRGPGLRHHLMETESYRPARLILLGEDASPQLRRSASLDALVTPQSPPFFVWHTAEDPYVPPNTPTASPPPSRPAVFPTPYTCSPTARTASAWPRALARPRSGPRWRKPGSGNRRHHRDDPAHRPRAGRRCTRMYQPPSAEPPPGIRIATGPQIPVMRGTTTGGYK